MSISRLEMSSLGCSPSCVSGISPSMSISFGSRSNSLVGWSSMCVVVGSRSGTASSCFLNSYAVCCLFRFVSSSQLKMGSPPLR